MFSGDMIPQSVLSIQISIETNPKNTKTTSGNDITPFEPEKSARNHGIGRNEDPTPGVGNFESAATNDRQESATFSILSPK